MKYKKILVGFVLLCCALFVGWKITKPQSNTLQSNFSVSITINTGSSIATYNGVLASTVFEGLVRVTKKNNIPLETKQYDFGVFVEKIGIFNNTKDKVWIYYINGKSGDVAADKKTVKNNDAIEWRYTKPIY